jgi:hypothetical protein
MRIFLHEIYYEMGDSAKELLAEIGPGNRQHGIPRQEKNPLEPL